MIFHNITVFLISLDESSFKNILKTLLTAVYTFIYSAFVLIQNDSKTSNCWTLPVMLVLGVGVHRFLISVLQKNVCKGISMK